LFIVALPIVALDQWTKSLVRNDLPLGTSWLPSWLDWLSPYARIVHWYNTGAAFGLFKQGWLIFTILAFIVAGAILYYYPRLDSGDWLLRLALGMQMGGALGNLISRLTMGGQVTDFISVGNFPVFNVADSSITVGVGLLLLTLWIKDNKEGAHDNQSELDQITGKGDSAEGGSEPMGARKTEPAARQG
jgi:signal peptidase II